MTGKDIAFIDLKAQRNRIRDRIDAAIARVLDHGAFIMGPEIGELEQLLSDFVGVKHTISCSSGTDALLLPLMAMGIGLGDAVFVPAFTFVAAAEVSAILGATPFFVDVLPDTFNMDPASLEIAISEAKKAGLKARAVISVDLYGQLADYDAIAVIAEANNLDVIEDAAQSFGATLNGARAGSFGRVAGTSFFPAKPLGCYGDGGAIFTDDDDLAKTIRQCRTHGQGGRKYNYVEIGMNGRLDTMQAAILIEKLKIFPDEIVARQRVADRYNAALSSVVKTPVLKEGATAVWGQYTIIVADRDLVAARLGEANIPVAIHYPKPLNDQVAYNKFPTVSNGAPVSRRLAREVLSLPMHPYLEHDTQDRIIDAVIKAAS